MTDRSIVVVGGGHNALVAAAYLERAGVSVTVLEAGRRFGGAVSGGRPFPGVGATLSRYAYLVSLFPESVARELGLDLELRARRIASYTPRGDQGLLVEREPGALTHASFAGWPGGPAELAAWRSFEERLRQLARIVEPTFTRPLPEAQALRDQLDPALWCAVVEHPLGELLEQTFADDTVRGIVLTDALIGMSSRAHDPSLRQNRCFLYHVVGRGTGEWQVPVGGMAAVARELVRAARAAGAALVPNARVVRIDADGPGAVVETADGRRFAAAWVLAGCAPSALSNLLGHPATAPSGCQTKINLVLRRLPRLRSGHDPAVAFAGTTHLGQGYGRLEEAYGQSVAGTLPDPLPAEVYCHSLTDPSVLDPDLREAGGHTLTLFGLHTPVELFRDDPDGMRRRAEEAALRSLQAVLAEPLEDCLARDANGRPCVETLTPLDLEAELGMPGGHIFHGDLEWPWLADDEHPETPAQRWGVATDHPRVLLCGSGARRGGAVSGIGGHNAAQAVLEALD